MIEDSGSSITDISVSHHPSDKSWLSVARRSALHDALTLGWHHPL